MAERPLRILQVTPELSPYAKAGGLGDVTAALAKYLSRSGHEVRVLCPKYGFMDAASLGFTPQPGPFTVYLGYGHREYARLWQGAYPDSSAQVILVEYNSHFGHDRLYAHEGYGPYAFFCRAAIDYCHATGWYPDVIHCHDWTTGLIPAFLNTSERGGPLRGTATVFTIHNLQHQGWFGQEVLGYAGLPRALFDEGDYREGDCVNFMKGALLHATKLTTVSGHYAEEIKTPEYGCGLEGVLKLRSADLVGILNGIDTEEWNPRTDPHIAANYSVEDMAGKKVCKEALQRRLGLDVEPGVPLFGVVSRLYDQKGLDLLAHIVTELMQNMNLQIALLGSGDQELENRFRWLSSQYPGRMSVTIGYDNALSHQIEAGADIFLMPSRFEPCGLNQMYSMAYGTLPVVRETGGLVDSVEQFDEKQGTGTGFRFKDATVRALYDVIGWANATYWDMPQAFANLQRNAMSRDMTWDSSVHRYEEVFRWASHIRRHGFGLPSL